MSEPSYWTRLRHHPGVATALVWSLACLSAVFWSYRGTWEALAVSVPFAALPWVLVLWTARTQPVPSESEDR